MSGRRGSGALEPDYAGDDEDEGADAREGKLFAEDANAQEESDDGFQAEDEDIGDTHVCAAHGDSLTGGADSE